MKKACKYLILLIAFQYKCISQNAYSVSNELPFEVIENTSGTCNIVFNLSKANLGLSNTAVRFCQEGTCENESVLVELYKNGVLNSSSLVEEQSNGSFTDTFTVNIDTINLYRIIAKYQYVINCSTTQCDTVIHSDTTSEFNTRKRISYESWYFPSSFQYNCSDHTFIISGVAHDYDLGDPTGVDACDGLNNVQCIFPNYIHFLLYRNGAIYTSQLLNVVYLGGKRWTYSFTVPSGVYGTFQARVQFNYVTTYGLYGFLNWYHFLDDYSDVYVVNDPYQYCCFDNTTLSNNVNSGDTDKEEAGSSIVAVNTINAGASAMYHAGNNIELSPNFSALSGSYFHGYIEGCTSNFYRTGHSTNNDSTRKNNSVNATTSNTNNYNSPSKKISPEQRNYEDIVLSPNPNNGSFDLLLPDGLRTTEYLLTVEQMSGGQIYSETGNIRSDKIKLNLHDVKSGMYLVKLNCNNKLYYEKVVITE